MTQIEATARSWANTYGKQGTKEHTAAYDSFLVGWSAASATAVTLLHRQFEGSQHGLKVSYAIAAEVLKVDMKEYENRSTAERVVDPE